MGSAPLIPQMGIYMSSGVYSLGVARLQDYRDARELLISVEKNNHGLASWHGAFNLSMWEAEAGGSL